MHAAIGAIWDDQCYFLLKTFTPNKESESCLGRAVAEGGVATVASRDATRCRARALLAAAAAPWLAALLLRSRDSLCLLSSQTAGLCARMKNTWSGSPLPWGGCPLQATVLHLTGRSF